MKIEIISGSPRQGSITNRIARYLLRQLQEKEGVEAGLIDVRDYPLPFVQQVWSSPDKVPADFKELGDRVFGADAFILVSPEYNGGYSPALKNLLDHFPKQNRKVFAIATGTNGALGAMRSAQQLIQLVAALFGILSPQLLLAPHTDKKFDAEGNLVEPGFEKGIDLFLEEFLWLASTVKKAK